MTFVKGKSGNPKGRKVENTEIKELAKAKSPLAFNKIVSLLDSEDAKVCMAAAKEILDRAFGKPAQAVEVSGKNGAKLAALIEIVRKDK